MASPFINAVVSGWLEQGHGGDVLAALRDECRRRSALMRERARQPRRAHANQRVSCVAADDGAGRRTRRRIGASADACGRFRLTAEPKSSRDRHRQASLSLLSLHSTTAKELTWEL
ncbi:MAG: hypothetical protein JSR59_23405 [Proteobacteria bacterium]|nr:hypothetical protein [Pseudomonadota bacterium]